MLAEHVSAPLSDVCRISNKPSNNFVAEAIYKTLGGELEEEQFSRMRTHIGSAEIVVINKVDLLDTQRPQTVTDTVTTLHHTARRCGQAAALRD